MALMGFHAESQGRFPVGTRTEAGIVEALAFHRQMYDALKAGIGGEVCRVVERAEPPATCNLDRETVGLQDITSSHSVISAKGCGDFRAKTYEVEDHMREVVALKGAVLADGVEDNVRRAVGCTRGGEDCTKAQKGSEVSSRNRLASKMKRRQPKVPLKVLRGTHQPANSGQTALSSAPSTAKVETAEAKEKEEKDPKVGAKIAKTAQERETKDFSKEHVIGVERMDIRQTFARRGRRISRRADGADKRHPLPMWGVVQMKIPIVDHQFPNGSMAQDRPKLGGGVVSQSLVG